MLFCRPFLFVRSFFSLVFVFLFLMFACLAVASDASPRVSVRATKPSLTHQPSAGSTLSKSQNLLAAFLSLVWDVVTYFGLLYGPYVRANAFFFFFFCYYHCPYNSVGIRSITPLFLYSFVFGRLGMDSSGRHSPGQQRLN